MRIAKFAVIGVVIVGLAACAEDDPNKRAKTGAAIGALAGVVIGNQAGNRSKGRLVGAAVGALTGAAVGHYMDKQHQELQAKLKAEEDAKLLDIQSLSDDSLKIGIASEASFDVDSSDLKSTSLNTFSKIAGVLKTYDSTIIHVVGHTDSTGSDSYNQALSERRAQSVAQYLSAQGVPGERLITEGRGEREPRASNSTNDGRRLNRRVDIVIKPVVEGQEERAYAPPPPLTS